MNDKRGKLVVISAPSGTGKSTVISELLRLRPDFEFSVSATTRKIRPHEADGRNYHFITREEFERQISEDKFFEWAQYVGNYYGTPVEPVERHLKDGKTVILEIDVQGACQVMEKAPYAITIFIVPPSMGELERRLRGRGTDTEEKLLARLERAKLEFDEKDKYAHIVVNDIPAKAAERILQIIEDKAVMDCCNMQLTAKPERN